MDSTVRLVFTGELLPGHALPEVQRKLAALLRLDDARLQMMFSGGRVVLKRGMTPADAQRYVDRLAEVGARVHQEFEDAAPPAAAQPATPPAPVPAPRAATPSTPELALAPLAPAAGAEATADGPSPAAAPAAAEVECPNCGERQTMRAFCRKCSSNLEMALANQADAQAQRRAERDAALEARRAGRDGGGAGSGDGDVAVDYEGTAPIWGLGFSGRMGRRRYFVAGALLFLVGMAVFALALMLLGGGAALLSGGAGGPTLMVGFLSVVFWLAMLVLGLRLLVLRLHDCDMSGWWSLLTLVPVVNMIFSLVALLLPGTEGENRFGGVPKPGRWLHVFLALLMPLVGFGLVAALAIPAYQGYVVRAREAQQLRGGTPDMPARPVRNGSPDQMAAEALKEYEGAYARGQGVKAFAAARGGAWGWKVDAKTDDEARFGAMDACEAVRKPGTPLCQVVDMNGEWQGFEVGR